MCIYIQCMYIYVYMSRIYIYTYICIVHIKFILCIYNVYAYIKYALLQTSHYIPFTHRDNLNVYIYIRAIPPEKKQ